MIKNRIIGDSAFGTHLVPLIAAVMATNGDVLELGMGDYSTPVLHEVLKKTNRKLFSLETDRTWLNNYIDLSTDKHFIGMENPEYNWENEHNYSVVFVDNAPAENRIKAIELYKDLAEIIVVHDTEKMKYYGYGKVFPQFKYQFTYERYKKTTTLLSNKIDVTKIL